MQMPTYGLDERTALWPDRWPLIALQECIDQVEAAPKAEKEKVRWGLHCQSCEKATACLTAKQKELGGLLYDREILTKPRAAASSLFPYEAMEPMFDRQLELAPYYRKPFGMEEQLVVSQGWDIAWSEKTGGDWLVCFTSLLDRKTGKKTILDISRWQRIGFDDQCRMIEEMAEQYSADIVVIEDAFAQRVWVQHLTTHTAVPVVGHAAGGKKSFEHGVPMLLLDVERQVWRIPMMSGGRKIEEVKNWLSECEAFGWQDDKLEGVGEHDDTVMAWWHSNWGLEKMRTPLIGRAQSPNRREAVEF